MQINSTPDVKKVIDKYPEHVQIRLFELRQLIIGCARQLPSVDRLEETLKWGEPGYKTKHGSTLRIDWKEKTPDQYAMYFQCTSKLVPTFREVFGDLFRYESNRAIVFDLEKEIPEEELKDCIKAALRYHLVKKRPFLGIQD